MTPACSQESWSAAEPSSSQQAAAAQQQPAAAAAARAQQAGSDTQACAPPQPAPRAPAGGIDSVRPAPGEAAGALWNIMLWRVGGRWQVLCMSCVYARSMQHAG